MSLFGTFEQLPCRMKVGEGKIYKRNNASLQVSRGFYTAVSTSFDTCEGYNNDNNNNNNNNDNNNNNNNNNSNNNSNSNNNNTLFIHLSLRSLKLRNSLKHERVINIRKSYIKY